MRKKLMCMILASIFCLCGLGMLGGCGTGTLYRLDEAYEAGLITYEDLLNIAYHNGDIELNKEVLEGFEPKAIGKLSEWKSLQIRESLADLYLQNKYAYNPTADGFEIEDYLGCYRGCYAFQFMDAYLDTMDWVTPSSSIQTVGNIKFWYGNTSLIYLWKQ